jgi:hypothetical protein
MGQGKFIPETTQWIIIRLASTMSIEDTAMYSDVSPSSIRRILAHFKETGDVMSSKRSKIQPTSTLCDLDIQVWFYLVIKLVLDMFLVHAFRTRLYTWYVSWWTAPGAPGSLWSFSITINYLENIDKGWIFHEKGVWLVFVCSHVWLLDRLAGSRWSAVQKNGLIMHFVLASTRQTSSFLLMRALWTVEQHTVAALGQYVAGEQLAKLSSAVDGGM